MKRSWARMVGSKIELKPRIGAFGPLCLAQVIEKMYAVIAMAIRVHRELLPELYSRLGQEFDHSSALGGFIRMAIAKIESYHITAVLG